MKVSDSSQAFASLVRALRPAAAFHPSGAGVLPMRRVKGLSEARALPARAQATTIAEEETEVDETDEEQLAREKKLQAMAQAYVARQKKRYKRAFDCKAELTEDDLGEIQSLLDFRQDSKKNRDYEPADAAWKRLREFGVWVRDDLREWRADGEFWIDPYELRGSDAGRTEKELEQVEELLYNRALARNEKPPNFERADELKRQLIDLGAKVNDKLNEVCFPYHKNGSHNYERTPGDMQELTDEQLETINSLIQERLDAQMAHDFPRADAAKARLWQLGVQQDDHQLRWWVMAVPPSGTEETSFRRIVPKTYKMKGSRRVRTEEQLAEIEELVQQRAHAVAWKDDEKAFNLLKQLYALGVAVDDTKLQYTFLKSKDGIHWHHFTRKFDDSEQLEEQELEMVEEFLADYYYTRHIEEDIEEAETLKAAMLENEIKVHDDWRSWWVKIPYWMNQNPPGSARKNMFIGHSLFDPEEYKKAKAVQKAKKERRDNRR